MHLQFYCRYNHQMVKLSFFSGQRYNFDYCANVCTFSRLNNYYVFHSYKIRFDRILFLPFLCRPTFRVVGTSFLVTILFLFVHSRTNPVYIFTVFPRRPRFGTGRPRERLWGDVDDTGRRVFLCSGFFFCAPQ